MYKFGDKVKFSDVWLYEANRNAKKDWIKTNKSVKMIVAGQKGELVTVVKEGKRYAQSYHESFIAKDRKHESLISRIANLRIYTLEGEPKRYVGTDVANQIIDIFNQSGGSQMRLSDEKIMSGYCSDCEFALEKCETVGKPCGLYKSLPSTLK